MSSKVFVWGFKNTWIGFKDKQELIPIYHNDSTSEVWINKIIKNGDFELMLGKELTLAWLNSYFLEMDLFGSSKPLLVLEAQQLGEAEFNFLINKENIQDNQCVLSFTQIPIKYNKIKKHHNYISIASIPFWDKAKACLYFEKHYNVNIGNEFRSVLLETVDNSYYEISQKVYWLSLFSNQEKETGNLEAFMKINAHLDLFKYIDMINHKKMNDFWRELNKISSKQVEEVFPFIMSHLYKLSDTRTIESKKKKSSYDQKILNASKTWKFSEIGNLLKKLVSLHKKSRLKEPLIKSNIDYFELRAAKILS